MFVCALLYESSRRKPGWRFTAGFPFVLLMFWFSLVILLHSICCLYCKASVFDRRIIERLWKGVSDCAGLIFINCQFWCIFKEILNFQQDLPKWSVVRFFLICLCAAQLFCAFTLVCDCIFFLSCYIVLLSCLLSFVVLPVSFTVISPFCPFSVSSALPSHVLPSRFSIVWL